jgi:class 3 adenylate cyclase/CHASE2 domain-containing sensor protein
MRNLFGQVRSRRWGIIVGATVTLAATELWVAGGLDTLSMLLLDWQYRHVGRAEASDAIVMVDLDDATLESVHAWPWPRKLVGDLVDTLDDLGARSILLDMFFPDPTPRRIVDPRLDPDWDVDSGGRIVGEVNLLDAVDDDAEFAAALERAGDVYLAAIGTLHRPGWVRETSTSEGDTDRSRIEKLLEADFSMTAGEAADRLELSRDRLDLFWAPAKRRVARTLVAAYLSDHPGADWPDVYAYFVAKRAIDTPHRDTEDLLRAYRSEVALRSVLARAPDLPTTLTGRVQTITDPAVPLDRFSRVAEVGLVVLQLDDTGGVMRRVPLIADAGGRMLKQLGFAVACDYLDVDDTSMAIDADGFLSMRDKSGKREWRIQVDDNGSSLISWYIDRRDPRWSSSFRHIPASRVMDLPLMRAAIERERGIAANFLAGFVEVRFADAPASYADYERLVRDGRSTVVGEIERDSIAFVTSTADEIRQYVEAEGDAAELTDADRRILRLADAYRDGGVIERTRETIATLQREIDELKNALAPQISGKVCLFGYTASAVADTVNSPVFDEMPGVMAHANVINSMITNRFPRVCSGWMIVMLTLATGAVVTIITSWRGPWWSLASVVMVMAVLAAMTVAGFAVWDVHIDVVGPLVTAFVVWAFVTLYRQLTEERQKRAIGTYLAQYTSPAIAAELAGSHARRGVAVDFSPTPREVTCFFSDLKGFTAISERLGASKTRDLLNPYLEMMSAELNASGAIINKFMGDGIFAFFNPPVRPVERHAESACSAAVRSFEGLERLKRTLDDRLPNGEVRSLAMRVGIHTGEVFVGDYGSNDKRDYTCIGDTVNLAARLESACKSFGIACLISESTHAGAGAGYCVRSLGKLQVVGKREAVCVYELIGREGEVDDAVLEYAELFGSAVTRFQNREWSAARDLLKRCAQLRPDDLSAELYMGHIAAFEIDPPPADWNQAITLTVK